MKCVSQWFYIRKDQSGNFVRNIHQLYLFCFGQNPLDGVGVIGKWFQRLVQLVSYVFIFKFVLGWAVMFQCELCRKLFVGLIPHIGLILLYIAIVLTKFNVKGKGFLDKFCIATFSTKFNVRGKGLQINFVQPRFQQNLMYGARVLRQILYSHVFNKI